MELSELVNMIEINKPFHFARYGDGEWKVMFGDPGKNCDGHKYRLPGLRKDMLQTIKIHKTYFYGMQGLAKQLFPKRIEELLKGLFIPWIDADVFHDASEAGTLNPFIQALRKKRLCFIGPQHLTTPHSLMSYFACRPGNMFFFIPPNNCYMEKEKISKRIRLVSDEIDVFLFSAGFLSNILIWELHSFLKSNWLIDVGSLWDPYCGVYSRNYHFRIPEETKRKNFA